MSNIYIVKYNNYYNRIIKKFDTLAEYQALPNQVQRDISFNPNDGITTTQVVNFRPKGDYAIIANGTDIVSRWFIIESKRERTAQYTLSLKRDVVADTYQNLLNAPMFIEKATLDVNDPFILNNESMSFNQIKTSETPLKDETGCPWIVGYVPRDFYPTDDDKKPKNVVINYPLTNTADITVTNLSDWGYYNQINQVEDGSLISGIVGIYVYAANTPNMITAGFNLDGTNVNLDNNLISQPVSDITSPSKSNAGLQFTTDFEESMIYDFRNRIAKNITGKVLESFRQAILTEEVLMSEGDFTAIQKLQGQIIHETSTNTYYKVNVEINTSSNTVNCTANESSILNSNINRNAVSNNLIIGNDDEATNYRLKYTYNTYKITLEQAYESVTIDLTGDRYHLVDQPYDMFCMPYSDYLEIYKNGTLQFKANKNLALSVGTSIGASVGNTGVYDVQLLPYCPVRYCIKNGKFDFGDSFVTPIKKDTTTIGYLFWANTSNFTFNIEKIIKVKPDAVIEQRYAETTNALGVVSVTNPFPLANITGYEVTWSTIPSTGVSYSERRNQFDISFGLDNKNKYVEFKFQFSMERTVTDEDMKVANECDMYRLCSPNYNGQFEFNIAKNGNISYFNVDCTYKPFNPYIHINPNFSKLYGKDFNDARGLVCSGDFSLPQISSAWANYEANNKNYENVFNRQIQNMEVRNDISRIQELFSSGASALTTGIGVGTMTGNVAGGIAGGLFSAIGGIADYTLSERLRAEQMDYTKDMYGYSLDNIKAIPYSLSKVGAFNNNNKLFPFIEYYTCSNEEKEALRNKIKYNGMTVMRIGTLNEFLKNDLTYIKGRLIRLEGLNEDYHYLNDLNNELYMGVFIKWE